MAKNSARVAVLQTNRSAATAKKCLERGKKYGRGEIKSVLGQDVNVDALITKGVLRQVEGGMYMLA